MQTRALADVEKDIEDWLATSTATWSRQFVESGGVWALKFISPRFLAGFLKSKKMTISATPGFTWGDGVYVAPLENPYSTMIYGRAGIMGRIPWTIQSKVYDACQTRGVELYQEWIQYFRGMYRFLTTTVHANLANRALRNAFRRKFAIDVVSFPPDQFNRVYVDPVRDCWLVVSDWQNLGPQAPGQRPINSSRILDCEWVAMVEEEFQESVWRVHYLELFGSVLHAPGKGGRNPTLSNALLTAYQNARAGAVQPLRVRA